MHAALGTEESVARSDQITRELERIGAPQEDGTVSEHDRVAASVALLAASEQVRVRQGSDGVMMGDADSFGQRRELLMRAFGILMTAPQSKQGPEPLQACVLRVLGQVLIARGCVFCWWVHIIAMCATSLIHCRCSAA